MLRARFLRLKYNMPGPGIEPWPVACQADVPTATLPRPWPVACQVDHRAKWTCQPLHYRASLCIHVNSKMNIHMSMTINICQFSWFFSEILTVTVNWDMWRRNRNKYRDFRFTSCELWYFVRSLVRVPRFHRQHLVGIVDDFIDQQRHILRLICSQIGNIVTV